MKGLLREEGETCGRRAGATAARFALVGLSGVGANLAALHLLAGVVGLPDALSSALAIEASLVWNFLLHDAFTFRDRRGATAGGRATRETLGTPCGAALAEQLASSYEPVFLSQPRGLLEVWRPRTTTARR
jgi:putative flippase GtrA